MSTRYVSIHDWLATRKRKPYMIIDNKPCRVIATTVACAGKHGRKRLHVKGICLHDQQEVETCWQYIAFVDVPIFTYCRAHCNAFDAKTKTATLMDTDMRVPVIDARSAKKLTLMVNEPHAHHVRVTLVKGHHCTALHSVNELVSQCLYCQTQTSHLYGECMCTQCYNTCIKKMGTMYLK